MAEEQRMSRASVALNLAAGVAMGAASPFLGRALFAGLAGILLAGVLALATKRFISGKGHSWWAQNGLFIYLFTWLDSWVLVFNLYL